MRCACTRGRRSELSALTYQSVTEAGCSAAYTSAVLLTVIVTLTIASDTISQPEATWQLQQCYNQITQSAAAPPIDAAIVQGTVTEVTGLQKSHRRKHLHTGPPQPGGAWPKRVKSLH